MQKLCSSLAALVCLSGCVAGLPGAGLRSGDLPRADFATDATKASAPSDTAPVVQALDIEEFDQKTKCEDITRPGSRIVVARHCYTPDAAYDAAMQEVRRQEVLLVQDALRREQENMERMQREREMQMQREMARQVIVIQQPAR